MSLKMSCATSVSRFPKITTHLFLKIFYLHAVHCEFLGTKMPRASNALHFERDRRYLLIIATCRLKDHYQSHSSALSRISFASFYRLSTARLIFFHALFLSLSFPLSPPPSSSSVSFFLASALQSARLHEVSNGIDFS